MKLKRLIPVVAIVAALGATGVAYAEGGTSAAHSAAASTVSLKSTKFGKILVNSKGFTLYLWAKDPKNKSVCSGGCASVWPPLLVSGKPTAGAGLSKGKLGTINRGGGKKQVTYNGHALYTFVSDTKAGQITGQRNGSFGAPWYVVSASGSAITKG